MKDKRGDFWVDLQWHSDPEPEPEPKGQEPKGTEPTKETPALSKEDVEKMIQSATDRVRTEYSSKLKEVEAEKEELQKERMSEKERATFELEQERKRNEQTALELAQRELALERANIIQELSVPKDLAPFVQGKDRNDILSNTQNLMKSFNDAVLREVNRKLATSGDTPQAGETQQPINYNIADWQKIWAMPPGPEKDAALSKAFDGLAGQQIAIQGEG